VAETKLNILQESNEKTGKQRRPEHYLEFVRFKYLIFSVGSRCCMLGAFSAVVMIRSMTFVACVTFLAKVRYCAECRTPDYAFLWILWLFCRWLEYTASGVKE
jgi:hypothetical protein